MEVIGSSPWPWHVRHVDVLELALVPHLNFVHALAIGACVTPTDPVLSNSIVKGKFADKNIPKPLQKIIIGESGANDGLEVLAHYSQSVSNLLVAAPFLHTYFTLRERVLHRVESLISNSFSQMENPHHFSISLYLKSLYRPLFEGYYQAEA